MTVLENIQNSDVVRAYRQGWLAWLGAHKAAFDFANDGVQKMINERGEVVNGLVEKGEGVETMVQDNVRTFFARFNTEAK